MGGDLAGDRRLVQQGKILYAGSSNFAGWQVAQANEAARRRGSLGLVSEQCLYNLFERRAETDVIPAAQAVRPRRHPLVAAAPGPARGRAAQGGGGGRGADLGGPLGRGAGRSGRREKIQAYEDLLGKHGLRARRGRARLAAHPAGGDRAHCRAADLGAVRFRGGGGGARAFGRVPCRPGPHLSRAGARARILRLVAPSTGVPLRTGVRTSRAAGNRASNHPPAGDPDPTGNCPSGPVTTYSHAVACRAVPPPDSVRGCPQHPKKRGRSPCARAPHPRRRTGRRHPRGRPATGRGGPGRRGAPG